MEFSMKKNLFLLAAVCFVSIAGCKKEDFELTSSDRMEVDVSGISYTRYTKAGEDCSSDGELLCTKKFVTQEGDTLYVSAYLSDLDDYLPQQNAEETKGVPIYFNGENNNLGTLYGELNTTVYDTDGTVYQSKDKYKVGTSMENVSISYNEEDKKWKFAEDKTYYWPQDGRSLYFCTMAPVELLPLPPERLPDDAEQLVSDIKWDKDSKNLTFTYTMPDPEEITDANMPRNDAENQKDLLVAVDKNNRSDGSDAKINLYHALTGVRFVMGETNKSSIKLKSVSLNAFYSSGKATFNPAATYDSPKVTWSDLKDTTTYSQTFSDYELWHLNAELDETGNKTFMVIPQELNNDAKLSIYLANALHPEVLTFNMITEQEPKLKNWSEYAGKMITFRINSYVGLVSVKVEDDCVGNTKSNLKITNDGTTDIYVRAQIVGNWVNEDDEILASWKETQSFGEFTTSKGAGPNLETILDDNWSKASDGFYYYKYYIKPGEILIHNMFDSFSVTSKPVDTSGSWAGDVKMQISALEMNILVQAVIADGTSKSAAAAAWGNDNIGFLTTEADK